MERITRFRATVLLVLFLVILGIFAIRMYNVQVVDSETVVQDSSTYTSYYTVIAARGDILDRNGNVLVTNRTTYNLTFNNYVLYNSGDTNGHLYKLVSLCAQLGVEYIDHFPVTVERPYEYTLDEYNSSWKGYFQDYLNNMGVDSDVSAQVLMRKLRTYYKIPDEWTDEEARRVIGLRYELSLRTGITNLDSYVFIEDVDEDTMNAINELNIPGLEPETSLVREYKTTCAAHILGSLGKITAENWADYKELGYSMDASVGTSGFEAAFEDELHGTNGRLARTVDSEGNIIGEYYTKYPVAGNNVETTIDLNLQIAAETALEKYFNLLKEGALNDGDTGTDVQGGAVVVLDVNTGAVLACASYPTYDLENYNEMYNELLAAENNPLKNRALQEVYAPGSVYKMSMATAALEEGIITRYSTITTKGIFTKYSGFSPRCLIYTNSGKNHGTINVMEALQVSCNYFFYVLGDTMDIETMDRYAKAYGLGEKTGVELYEANGYRANPETKASLFGDSDDADWYISDQVLAAIGQSENRFTPIQMANYIATIANGGTRYRCTFLSRVVSSDYSELIYENEPEVLNVVDASDSTLETVREGMRQVVTKGTAYTYFKDYTTVTVAAKTGTAQTGLPGSSNGSFACFAPYEDPELAIIVYGEKAGVGGYLGQIAIEIMDVYFGNTAAVDTETYENQAE